MSFKIKFWGVRGSIPTPSAHHIAFGGNTSCVEVSCGGERIILDAGTGIRLLGHWFQRKNVRHSTLLLSHAHWDHIMGFPFFSPAYHADRALTVMAGHLGAKGGIRGVLASQMSQPTFPVPLDAMKARIAFEDFSAGDTFMIGARVRVRTTTLNHPDGATGYRVEYDGRSICYVTDTEHRPGQPDPNILGLIEGSDLLIYDCTYTDAEFPRQVGWGHSTWEEGVRLARAAKVKGFAIFHHDPDHNDLFMESIEAKARAAFPGAFAAREHMRLIIG
jgi:phosphoribosyl 1,2-cyclic phosphodiesterase